MQETALLAASGRVCRAAGHQVPLFRLRAAHHGRAGCVAQLLALEVEPNQYNPPGGHSHCTALHSAAVAGHEAVVTLLIEAGADLWMRDLHHSATAADWAQFGGHEAIAQRLKEAMSVGRESKEGREGGTPARP